MLLSYLHHNLIVCSCHSELSTLREEMAAQDWYRKELEKTLLAAETDKQTMLTIVQSIKSLNQQPSQAIISLALP